MPCLIPASSANAGQPVRTALVSVSDEAPRPMKNSTSGDPAQWGVAQPRLCSLEVAQTANTRSARSSVALGCAHRANGLIEVRVRVKTKGPGFSDHPSILRQLHITTSRSSQLCNFPTLVIVKSLALCILTKSSSAGRRRIAASRVMIDQPSAATFGIHSLSGVFVVVMTHGGRERRCTVPPGSPG